MTALYIAGAVLGSLGLLALAPVAVEAAYEDGRFVLTGRAGPVPVKLFPREKTEAGNAEKSAEEKKKRSFRHLTPPVLRILADCGCRAFAKLIRRVRIGLLQARYTAGGPDPYRAAMAYARAGLAMEGVARLVENADLRADVDFDGAGPLFAGRVRIFARLGTVLWGAAGFGMDFLRKYLCYKRGKGE